MSQYEDKYSNLSANVDFPGLLHFCNEHYRISNPNKPNIFESEPIRNRIQSNPNLFEIKSSRIRTYSKSNPVESEPIRNRIQSNPNIRIWYMPNLYHSNQNELLFRRKKSSHSSWPEPIARSVKESCLKKFIHRLSMAELSEVTCAICNVRTSVRNSKKISLSNIPNIHLLKVSDDFKNLIQSIQLSNSEHSNREILIIPKNNRTPMAERSQSDRFLYTIYEFINIFSLL